VKEDEYTINELLQVDNGNKTKDLTEVQYELPPHQRCFTHTLNLVASTKFNIDKYLSSSLSRSVYQSFFGKSVVLWNKASRSTVATDKFAEVAKRKLLVSTPTTWNSCYDAVERIIENSTTELNELCAGMELQCFNDKADQGVPGQVSTS